MSDKSDNRPAVVFDLGGVLLDWNPRYLYRKLFNDEAEMETFLATVCSPQWNLQQDAGRSFANAIAELSVSHPQHRRMIEAYYTRWGEMLAGPIEGTVSILSELRELGFDLYALSNWSAETFPIAHRRYDFLQWFDTIVLSGEEKVVKPDSRIYHILLQRIGRNARECIFIDDSPDNVAAAKALGFDAIEFTGPGALGEALAEREVLNGVPVGG